MQMFVSNIDWKSAYFPILSDSLNPSWLIGGSNAFVGAFFNELFFDM